MNLNSVVEYNKEFFKKLKFQQQEHIYKVNNIRIQSVSTLLENFYEKVDWEEKAERVAFREKTTTSAILKRWAEDGTIAAEDGTAVHLYAEVEHKQRQAERIKEKAVDKFFADLDRSRYVILHEELRMWHKLHWYCGTTDIILHDLWTGKDIIGDWKTNKNIHKNFMGKTLYHPFTDILDSPLGKFKVQTSFYQNLYEQTGREVSERWIIWLKADGTYELFKSPDYSARIEVWLDGKTFIKQ